MQRSRGSKPIGKRYSARKVIAGLMLGVVQLDMPRVQLSSDTTLVSHRHFVVNGWSLARRPYRRVEGISVSEPYSSFDVQRRLEVKPAPPTSSSAPGSALWSRKFQFVDCDRRV